MAARRRLVLLSLAVGAYFSTLFARVVLSPVVPDIIDAFSTSKGALGVAFTGMWGAYAVVQFPAGVLADRYGEKTLILAAVGCTGASSLLIAAAPSYPVFVLVGVLLGASGGLYPPAGTSLLTKRFRNTGQALGIHVAGANLAGLAAPVAAAYVAVRHGWRLAPVLTFLLTVPLFVLVWRAVEPTAPADEDVHLRSQFSAAAVRDVLARPSIAFTAAVGTVGVFTFNAIASFLPTFLIEFRSLSTTRAGTAFGVVYLCSALTMPVMGKASDYVDRDYAIAASLAGVAAGLALLLVAPATVPVLVAVVVVGAGISWGGSLHSRFMDLLDDAERGTGFGLIRSVTGVVGASGSAVVGTVADAAGWLPAYGLLVGLLAVTVLALLVNRLVGPGW
jgi:MFS family permease